MAIPKKTNQQSQVSAKTEEQSSSKPKLSKKAIIWYVIFALAWVLVSMIASQYIIALPMVALLGENISSPVWTCVYDALVYILALVLVLFVPPLIYRVYQKSHNKFVKANNVFSTNTEELGVKRFPTLVDIGLAPIGYIIYTILATMLTTVMSIFTWFNPDQEQNVGFSHYLTGPDRVIAMIALVIIAPLAEEIIMRGWLYGKVRSKIKVIPAILLVSVLFGFLHGQWNVAVSTFALSVVLCGLREITGTIWSGVLLHMLSNGVAFYLLFIAGM